MPTDNVIKLDPHRNDWIELIKLEGERTNLSLFLNVRSGVVDVVQVNDEGESITTQLTKSDMERLCRAYNESQR